MHREKRRRTASIAAACAVGVLLLFGGCRATERQEAGDGPPPRNPITRIPDLVGMDYERAKTSFLRAGGEVVERKPS